MPRRTKITTFSLPPELYEKVEQLIKTKAKTRSEFFRQLIELYLSSLPAGPRLSEADLAQLLKLYWQLRSTLELKVIVIGLGVIVNHQGKVLIGLRKQKDPWVENLSWVFPGGQLGSLDFEKELKKKIKAETAQTVKLNSLIASRVHPDVGSKPIQIVALYFYCQLVKEQTLTPGGDLVKLRWVKPTEVFKYFSTSVSDEVAKFLAQL